jgi:NAD(P)-dependent dehydrogenase (short-subunit alcohol dehydrogenase family)
VNLGGVFRAMKFAIPHMLRQGKGSIINIASVNGLVGLAGWAAYAASKGGIVQLTR